MMMRTSVWRPLALIGCCWYVANVIVATLNGGGGAATSSNRKNGITTTVFPEVSAATVTSDPRMETVVQVDPGYLYRGDKGAGSVREFTGTALEEGSFFVTPRIKVVEFYSPTCHHCRSFKNEYISVATAMQREHPNRVEFHAISCQRHAKLCQSIPSLRSVPAIYIIPPGVRSLQKAIPLPKHDIQWDTIQQRIKEAAASAAAPLGTETETLGRRRLDDADDNSEDHFEDASPDQDEAESEDQDEDESKDNGEEDDSEDEVDTLPKKTRHDQVSEDEEGDSEDAEADSDEDEEEERPPKRKREEGDSEDEEADSEEEEPRPKTKYQNEEEDDDSEKDEEHRPKRKHQSEDEEDDSEEDEEHRPKRKHQSEDEEDDSEEEGEEEDGADSDEDVESKDGNEHGKRPHQVVDSQDGDEEEEKDREDEKDSSDEADEASGEDDGDEESNEEDGTEMPLTDKDYVPEQYKTKPAPGAALARTKKRDTDRYKETMKKELERRKRRRDRKDKRHRESDDEDRREGATKTMRANKYGTKEFHERQRKYKDLVKKRKNRNRRRKKSIVYDEKATEKGKYGQLAYEKKVVTRNIVQHIPIVKNIVKVSAEEELIRDCSLAFLHGIKFSLYKSRNPLTNAEKLAFANWLDLLRIALPPEWGVQSLIYDLKQNIESLSQRYVNLDKLLQKHALVRGTWSASCQKGLSCGYWKLFHVLSVGMAEHRGGLNLIESEIRPVGTRVFSPLEAADVLRDYILHFFGCEKCIKRFLGDYSECNRNRRCDRLADSAQRASDDDWKEFALWLWEYHNDLSIRLLNEEADSKLKLQQQSVLLRAPAGPGFAPTESTIAVIWPAIDDCMTCLKEDGSWNEVAVFRQLERVYWPGFDFDTMDSRLVYFVGEDISSPRLTVVLVCSLLFILYWLRQSLTSPHIQRTILFARSLGPNLAISTGPKARSA